MVRKQGFCGCCGEHHTFDVTGALKVASVALGLAGIAAMRHPAPAILSVIGMLFGDAIEEWIAARCPTCGVALDLIRIVATT